MRLLTIVTAAAVMALAYAANPAQATTRLISNCFWPPQHPVCTKFLPTWAKWVEKATEGRVKIIIPPKSLAPPPQQWASVEKGIADTAFQFNGFIANRVWGPTVAMQPFIATHDSPAMSQALWETYEKYFPHEYKGIHLLSLWVITPAELWSQTDKPVNSIADLKSRKIWALPGTNAAIMKAVGAGVVSGPAVQMNEIISRGVVDAYVGVSPASVRDFRLIPYTKWKTQFSRGIYSTSFSFLMNQKKWDALSKKDQDAITSVSGAKFGRMISAYWVQADKESVEKEKKAGIKTVKADPKFEAALIKIGDKLTKKWIETANKRGLDGQGAYDFYVKRVHELSRKMN
ncbi:MAG: TRAP transporter substrate-binding protein DctP [Pseudolabrys sp.]|jgi:TRAP-type C4-dicarboxylate transport system substrate-binding protein